MKNIFVFFNFQTSFSRHLNNVSAQCVPSPTALKKMKPHYLRIPTTKSLALTNLMSFRRCFFFAMERTFTMNSVRDGPARFLSTFFADRSLSIQNQFYSLRLPTMMHSSISQWRSYYESMPADFESFVLSCKSVHHIPLHSNPTQFRENSEEDYECEAGSQGSMGETEKSRSESSLYLLEHIFRICGRLD